MPIRISELNSAATRYRALAVSTLTEAKARRIKTAFLCHSHRDSELVKGFVTMLGEAGWHVYVDWNDAEMPETPNGVTASRIRTKIVELDYFLFLATANSMSSRWCPWEIGYADGKKPIERILVIPTTDGIRTHGNEYMQLYRQVDLSNTQGLVVREPGQTASSVPVRSL